MALVRRYRAHATASHAQDCPDWSLEDCPDGPTGKQKGKIYKSQFFYFQFQIMYSLRAKFVSGNIKYLFTIFTLVANVTLHVLSDSFLFQSVRAWVGVMVLMLRHLHAQDCPA